MTLDSRTGQLAGLGIVLLFAAASVFLLVWYAVHGGSEPDWLMGIVGIFVGFIAHAFGVSSGVAAASTPVVAAVPASGDTAAPGSTGAVVGSTGPHIGV